MQTITFPDLNCAVHGAAFTAPECPTDSVLPGFRVPQDGLIHIGLLHGDVTTSDSRYRPIRAADIAGSGLDYLALGHVHSCSGVLTAGAVPYAYCGCIEGRGFDELGERGFLFGEVGAGTADLRFVPLPGAATASPRWMSPMATPSPPWSAPCPMIRSRISTACV